MQSPSVKIDRKNIDFFSRISSISIVGPVSMSYHLFFWLWNIEHPLMYGIQEKPYQNQPRKRNKFCLVPNNNATNECMYVLRTYTHSFIHQPLSIDTYIRLHTNDECMWASVSVEKRTLFVGVCAFLVAYTFYCLLLLLPLFVSCF